MANSDEVKAGSDPPTSLDPGTDGPREDGFADPKKPDMGNSNTGSSSTIGGCLCPGGSGNFFGPTQIHANRSTQQQSDPIDPYDVSGIPNHAPYDGFWGGLDYFFNGGLENGIKYNRDGTPRVRGVVTGTPPSWFGGTGALKIAGKGIKMLVQQRGVWRHAINGRIASKETLKAAGLLPPKTIPTAGKAVIPEFIEKAEEELAKRQNPTFWGKVEGFLMHLAKFFGE